MPRSTKPKSAKSLNQPTKYAAVLAQIETLQRQAEEERAGVIARIREAVTYYKLQPDEIFGRAKQVHGPRTQAKQSTRTTAPAAPAPKVPKPPKFSDGTNHWSGRGPLPKWFKAALESGKSRDDLLIKS
jgi:DNA-binding protein H-NS